MECSRTLLGGLRLPWGVVWETDLQEVVRLFAMLTDKSSSAYCTGRESRSESEGPIRQHSRLRTIFALYVHRYGKE